MDAIIFMALGYFAYTFIRSIVLHEGAWTPIQYVQLVLSILMIAAMVVFAIRFIKKRKTKEQRLEEQRLEEQKKLDEQMLKKMQYLPEYDAPPDEHDPE